VCRTADSERLCRDANVKKLLQEELHVFSVDEI
jgi:hypothetical protein